MVNMIVHDLLATPVATALLALQLSANVRWGVSTSRCRFPRTASNTPRVPDIRVRGVIMALSFQYHCSVFFVVLAVVLLPCVLVVDVVLALPFQYLHAVFDIVLAAVFPLFFAIVSIVAAIVFLRRLVISSTPLTDTLCFARSAKRVYAIFGAFAAREFGTAFCLTADAAAFGGRGTIGASHQAYSCWLTPPAASNSAGAFLCLNYSTDG